MKQSSPAVGNHSTDLGLFVDGDALTTGHDTGIKISAQVGILVGQVFFGFLADRVGRKRIYGVELIIIIVATVGQTLAGQDLAVNIFGVLIFWRFILGIGIGGDYPVSAIIASEFANTKDRGRIMASVFAAQAWGQLTAALVSLVVVRAFKGSLINLPGSAHEAQKAIDTMWRIVIGVGAVPAAIALGFRLTIPETPRYAKDVERNFGQAREDVNRLIEDGRFDLNLETIMQRLEAPQPSWKDFFVYFRKPSNAKVLFGTAYSWFAICFCGHGLVLISRTGSQ